MNCHLGIKAPSHAQWYFTKGLALNLTQHVTCLEEGIASTALRAMARKAFAEEAPVLRCACTRWEDRVACCWSWFKPIPWWIVISYLPSFAKKKGDAFHTSLQAWTHMFIFNRSNFCAGQVLTTTSTSPSPLHSRQSQGTKSDSPRTSSKRLAQSLPTKVKNWKEIMAFLETRPKVHHPGGALLRLVNQRIWSIVVFKNVPKPVSSCCQPNLAFWTSLVSMVFMASKNVKRIHGTGCAPLTIRRQVVFQRNNHRTRRSFKSCIADGLISWVLVELGSETPKIRKRIFLQMKSNLNLDLCRWSLDPLV